MESRKKESKGKSQILFGSFLIIFSLIIFGVKSINSYLYEKETKDSLTNFYNIQEEIIIQEETKKEENPKPPKTEKIKKEIQEEYIAVIKIPKIGLEKGIFKKESKNNNVNRNIQILKESSYPDQEKGNFILAGHSGSGRVAFFRNLYKVNIDDLVEVIFKGKSYNYKIVNKYEVPKTGVAHIKRNGNVSSITLVTCKHNTNKQIILIGEIIEKEK